MSPQKKNTGPSPDKILLSRRSVEARKQRSKRKHEETGMSEIKNATAQRRQGLGNYKERKLKAMGIREKAP